MKVLDWLRIGVAGSIMATWIGSMVIDWRVPGYDTPAALNTAALIVAGFLFAPSITRARKPNGNGNSA